MDEVYCSEPGAKWPRLSALKYEDADGSKIRERHVPVICGFLHNSSKPALSVYGMVLYLAAVYETEEGSHRLGIDFMPGLM